MAKYLVTYSQTVTYEIEADTKWEADEKGWDEFAQDRDWGDPSAVCTAIYLKDVAPPSRTFYSSELREVTLPIGDSLEMDDEEAYTILSNKGGIVTNFMMEIPPNGNNTDRSN